MSKPDYNYGDMFRKEANRRDKIGEDYGTTAKALDADTVLCNSKLLVRNSQTIAALYRVIEQEQYKLANLLRDRAAIVEKEMRNKQAPVLQRFKVGDKVQFEISKTTKTPRWNYDDELASSENCIMCEGVVTAIDNEDDEFITTTPAYASGWAWPQGTPHVTKVEDDA